MREFLHSIAQKYYHHYLQPLVTLLLPGKFERALVALYKKLVVGKLDSRLDQITLQYKSPNPELPQGVNVIGFINQIFGLSQQARNIGAALASVNIKTNYIDCQHPYAKSAESTITTVTQNSYNCNIFSVNADSFLSLYLEHGQDFFENRYNIHYGAWELIGYPRKWVTSTNNLMHEFWAMSNFVGESARQALTIPVLVLPFAVDFAIPHNFTRQDFGLPGDKFLFIFTYDISSMSSRKNPRAVIEAFNRAFPTNNNVGLVIKALGNNARKTHSDEKSYLKSLTLQDSRIHFIEKVLTDEEMKNLVNVCDCYVSLHRSEGFGIGMAEAMKMNKPVIATNYSGNTDFTRSDTACVVDYKLIAVGEDEYLHYLPSHVWADPNIDHAAEYMQKLYGNERYYQSIAAAGKKFIDENYSCKVVGKRFKNRLQEIGVLS